MKSQNKRYLFLLSLFSLTGLFLLIPNISFADIIGPDWFNNHCPAGQKEVECSYQNKEMFAEPDYSDCKRYMNDEHYYEIASHGSTWGGEIRYCYDASKTYQKSNTESVPEFEALTIMAMIISGIVGLLGLLIIIIKSKNHGV